MESLVFQLKELPELLQKVEGISLGAKEERELLYKNLSSKWLQMVKWLEINI